MARWLALASAGQLARTGQPTPRPAARPAGTSDGANGSARSLVDSLSKGARFARKHRWGWRLRAVANHRLMLGDTDPRFDNNVHRPPCHDQMFDIVAPYQHQLAAAVECGLLRDREPRLGPRAEPAAEASGVAGDVGAITPQASYHRSSHDQQQKNPRHHRLGLIEAPQKTAGPLAQSLPNRDCRGGKAPANRPSMLPRRSISRPCHDPSLTCHRPLSSASVGLGDREAGATHPIASPRAAMVGVMRCPGAALTRLPSIFSSTSLVNFPCRLPSSSPVGSVDLSV